MENLLASIPTLVTQQQNAELTREVSMEEVKQAVFALDGFSAVGVNGFTGFFYTTCWGIISCDLLQAVREFFCGVPIPKSIASTLIVLIPKKEQPSTFAEFKPISLCTFLNKIFTKISCTRMKSIMPVLISPKQSAFVEG